MHKLMISLLAFAGFVLVLGGVAHIDEQPVFTLAEALKGAGISLMGIGLWIVAVLWHEMHSHYNR
jgi:5-enolpyruvylshikimate-3-phosphate synthase